MTPQEVLQLTETVHGRVVELVTGAVVPPLPMVPDERVPKILPELVVFPPDQGNAWANKLKSDRHVVSEGGQQVKKVHAFMVYHKGLQNYPDRTVRSRPFRLTFGVDSFYQDSPGTANDSPGKRHHAEIVLAGMALWDARPFGVPNVKGVISLKESRGLRQMGDYLVRQSMITVVVELEPIAIPRS